MWFIKLHYVHTNAELFVDIFSIDAVHFCGGSTQIQVGCTHYAVRESVDEVMALIAVADTDDDDESEVA